MNNIDFLPQWYKKDKKQKLKYRVEYSVLAVMFCFMLIWVMSACWRISAKQRMVGQIHKQDCLPEELVNEYESLSNNYTVLQKKANVLANLDSRIDVDKVLGEISFLVNPSIVVSELNLSAEDADESSNLQEDAGNVLRRATAKGLQKKKKIKGDSKFKVTIKGVAFDPGDIALFVCSLEDSEYFCNVIPSYTRDLKQKVKFSGTKDQGSMSEFALECYLANYVKKQDTVASEVKGSDF